MEALEGDRVESREASTLYCRPPRVRAGTVRRERLFSLLESGMGGKLLVLCAPAGFGKTTLLADWLASRKRPSAWITVGRQNADGIPFMRALYQAVDLAAEGLPPGREPSMDVCGADAELLWMSVQDRAAEGLAKRTAGGRAVVIDDAHKLGSSALAIVYSLASALPPDAILILAGRTAPGLPLARFRSDGDLVEIGAHELSFDFTETREFIAKELGDDRADDDIGLLMEKTEGWAAALRMAALGLRDKPDAKAFLSSFSGARREVFDFFAEEALAHIDAGDLALLMDSSVLDELSGPVCSAVTGRKDADAALRSLEERGLFLVPLDDERRRYALHSLFREALYRRLESERPATIASLRIKAASWLAENGRHVEAMRQRLFAGDAEGAAELAEGRALASLERGRISELSEAIDGLPAGSLDSKPWLSIAASWTTVYAGRLAEAVSLADAVNTARARDEREARRVAGHAAAVRAYAANLEGDGHRAVSEAEAALDRLGDEDRMARAHAYKSMGFGLVLLHDYEAASSVLGLALAESRLAGLDHIRYLAALDLAYLASLTGRLDEALAICRRELGPSDSDSGDGEPECPAAGCLHAHVAQLALARGDIDTALYESRLGLELCAAWGNMDRLVFSAVTNAYALAAAGMAAKARARLEWLKGLPALTPRHSLVIATSSAELDPAGPDGRFFERAPAIKDENCDLVTAMVHAEVLLARRRPAEALAVAESAIARAVSWGHRLNELRLQCSAAEARLALGRAAEARKAAARVVEIVAQTGAVQSVVSRGTPFRDYLKKEGFLSGGGGSAIEDAFRRALNAGSAEAREGSALSPREREILSFLARGMTAEEIAPVLFISTNTVRSHVKNLYAKLGVHRRVEAVNKARSLGIA